MRLIVCRLMDLLLTKVYLWRHAMEINEVLAINIKKYRLIKGMSQEQLAEKAGLHRTYISAVERNVRNISVLNVGVIAKALDIKPYKLFCEEEA